MSTLPVGVRMELKGVSQEMANEVAAHIIAAGELVDVDPDLAYRHAEAARRRVPRLPVVREAAAETAYASGRYDVALREYRAIRRMTGGDELLPVLADCERALGRHREALELLGTLDPATRDVDLRIECLLVESGIRTDLGQRDEAVRLLRNAISRKVGSPLAQARLRYAYAEHLEAAGDTAGARDWFQAADKLDHDGALDSVDRVAALDGVVLPETLTVDEEPTEPDNAPEQEPARQKTGEDHDEQ